MRYDDFVTLGGSFGSSAPPPAALEVHRLGKSSTFAMSLTGAPAYCIGGSVDYPETGVTARSCKTEGRVDPASGDAWASRIRAECKVGLVKGSSSWTYRPTTVPWIYQVGVDLFGPKMGTYVNVNRSECTEGCAEEADRVWKCITDLAR
jgi:hypothetical protein